MSGVSLNSVSMVNLVMAIGLVVDYNLHIIHSFMVQDSKLSRDERVVCAMREIGMSVFFGILSTFIAVVFCARSRWHNEVSSEQHDEFITRRSKSKCQTHLGFILRRTTL